MDTKSHSSPFTSEFDEFVQHLLLTWHVPGLAIAVIDGTSTFSKGYGFAVLPYTAVTPETMFFAASTTKSFTAASMSLLIDDSAAPSSASLPKDLSWTSTLSSVIGKDFLLADESFTSQVTFEDALSNRTGLPDHKLSFKPNTASVKDAVRSLRHLPLAADLRSTYLYSSYMFTAVSHAIETMTQMRLGDFMRDRIWNPLGMHHTYWTPQEAEAAASSGVVLAHGYVWESSSEVFMEEPVPNFPAVSGAGAIISNVVDYAKWLRCMMAKSPPLSKVAHQTLTHGRIEFLKHATNPFPPPHSYALGWVVDTYRGHQVVWHSGGWTGFGSTMMYLPSIQWGFVMMGNTTGTSNCVQIILYMHLLDELLGTPPSDRVDWDLRLRERISLKRHDNQVARERLYPGLPNPGCPPSASLEIHAGRYRHQAYGDMNVELQDNSLIAVRLLQEIPMIIRMIHVYGDQWMARLEIQNQDPRDHEVAKAIFQIAEAGIPERLGLDLEPALNGKLIWFDRV